MTNFKRYNRYIGWLVFAIAAMTYLLTMEPTPSLWDCSEFIATSYKLEVGHPPGAPLYMLLARIASIFAPSPEYVPHMVNGMNCIASAFCILFLFWSITHIARRIITRNGQQMDLSSQIAVLGAGAVGALAYTFTDTFWFSAVEGEVYALSSMFTALVVWLMLKWEEHADEPGANRWIVLIAYLMGLSIGVHILNLLTIPALVYIYYFRKFNHTGKKLVIGFIIASVIGLLILGFINGIIIPYTVYLGAMIDVFFVNVLGTPVNTGIVVYALALLGGLFALIHFTHKAKLKVINFALLCLTMIFIGFSSYATVTIRAVANPPMNSNNPDNPHALLSVLNRDQYGSKPLLYGPHFSAPVIDVIEEDVWSYNSQKKEYEKVTRLVDYKYHDASMHFFPRMWNSGRAEEYKIWGAYHTEEVIAKDDYGQPIYDANGNVKYKEIKKFGKNVRNPLYDSNKAESPSNQKHIVEPTFTENLYFFFNYQLNYMYWRYFLWNFVGRQDDIQASKETLLHGNWLSGIDFIDEARLGPQDNLPNDVKNNPARNTYYFIPFILGLIGLFYQLLRDGRYFLIVLAMFVMMGFALVIYFNTCPSEPRERDYVYAGSFYAFCMWIGLGVLAIRETLSDLLRNKHTIAATVAAVTLSMSVPAILAAENWDDHDRSGRTYAHDIGWNYLHSVPKNAIIINYGDNDTFPLWYVQEVEGVRKDVRIMNSSYLGGDWYIDQMKCAANDAAGVPFSLPRSKYVGEVNNPLHIIEEYSYNQQTAMNLKEAIEFIKSDEEYTKIETIDGEFIDYLPSKHFYIPVNKENAIKSGIVKKEDADLILDRIEFSIPENKNYLLKNEMMILDMLANFDWKRPICFTQVYILQDFGLMDYLQFDGMAYRFVPIKTRYQSAWEIGRIDTDYTYPLLMEKFRYGNLADEDVLVDHFTRYNIAASRVRESFARVAKQCYIEGDFKRAKTLLDKGLKVFPITKIPHSNSNILPYIETYYLIGEYKTADAILLDYAQTLTDHLKYYSRFDEKKFEMIIDEVDDKYNSITNLLYNVAIKYNREQAINAIQKQIESINKVLGYNTDILKYQIVDSYLYYDYIEQGELLMTDLINEQIDIIKQYNDPSKLYSKKDNMHKMEATSMLYRLQGLAKDYGLTQIADNLSLIFEQYQITSEDIQDESKTISEELNISQEVETIVTLFNEQKNQEAIDMLIDVINTNVILIENFIETDESKHTPEMESDVVNAMLKLEEMYSVSYYYQINEIINYLKEYMLSLGYSEEDIKNLEK